MGNGDCYLDASFGLRYSLERGRDICSMLSECSRPFSIC